MTGRAAPVRIDVIGPLTVRRDGWVGQGSGLGSRKGRVLLALLATRGGQLVGPEAIAESLWPTDPPAEADRVIASLVSRLRALLGRDTIEGDSHGYRIAPAPTAQVDLAVASELVAEAESRWRANEPGLAAAAASRAMTVLTGGVVAPDLDADWVHEARTEQAALLRRARLVASRSWARVGRARQAVSAASDAVTTDPLDEEAARALMRAHHLSGNTAAGLRTFDSLRRALRESLGTDPSRESIALNTALLRGELEGSGRATTPGSRGHVRPGARTAATRTPFVGRGPELAVLEAAWSRAAGGAGGLVLLSGEAGVGKTRLAEHVAELAEGTGGLVLEARCYEGERSLLVQPLADALAVAAAVLPPDRVRSAATGQEHDLARILPGLHLPLDPARALRGSPGLERQRTLEAVSGFIVALTRDQPVLLYLDDLQNAGSLTVEGVHFLARLARHEALLVVTTIRPTEGGPALRLLGPVAERIELGPLGLDAVTELARSVGHGDRAPEIMERTRGHALFVVELLRDLAAGGQGRPESLQVAVLGRLARCGPDVEAVLRAGAVLGSAFDPLVAGALAGTSPTNTLTACESALAARLLEVRGPVYEFANDLVRDAVYAALPEPTRTASHRRAADLLTDQPEAVAGHAAAAGDWRRACLAWLLAAENALARFAARDAEGLAEQALSAADRLPDGELRARALLVRGHGRNAQSAFVSAHADFVSAAGAARAGGDERFEMIALRALSGDVTPTVARDLSGIEQPLHRMLDIARSLGDRAAEADALARLTVLASARLDFVAATRHVESSERAAEASSDPMATANALDARKHLLAYQGIVAGLPDVTNRLEPRLRRSGDLWSLQWTVFESSFPPLAAEDYEAAVTIMSQALEINRRSGYQGTEGWYLAHLGWLHRLRGDLPTALDLGARAVELARRHGRHRWWFPAAASHQGATLLAADRRAEALELLEPLRPVGPAVGDESYRLRVLGPLAEASGTDSDLRAADALLASIRTEPGQAWLLGADAYLSVARAHLARGEPESARRLLVPFVEAATANGWPALVRQAATILQRA